MIYSPEGFRREIYLRHLNIKKIVFLLVFLVILTGISFGADSDFKDISERHWAKDSVDDLVKLGVTQGYPDGTFRGSKNVSRYETAIFLTKLAQAVSGPTEDIDFAIEKLKKDLRVEIRALRAEIAQLKKRSEVEEEKPISGTFQSRMMFGNLFAGETGVTDQLGPVGPKVNYRLKTSLAKSLGRGANVKVNIDTMDAGFNGGDGDLATKILDIEGNMKVNLGFAEPVSVKVTAGPGSVIHTEEADANGNYIARSENYVVYERPYNGISFATKFGAMDTSLGYYARKLSNTGEIEVNHVKLGFYNYIPRLFIADEVTIGTEFDYLGRRPQATDEQPTDAKVKLDIDATAGEKFKYGIEFGFGKDNDALLGGFSFGLEDMWDSGTIINFKYRSIGKNYLHKPEQLDEYILAGTDNFGRLLINRTTTGEGVVDIGLEIIQVLTETINFITKADMRMAHDNSYDEDHNQCSFTFETGLVYDIAPNTVLETLYRTEAVPSATDKTTDLAQMSLLFKF